VIHIINTVITLRYSAGGREQGQGAGSREQGAESREQGAV